MNHYSVKQFSENNAPQINEDDNFMSEAATANIALLQTATSPVT